MIRPPTALALALALVATACGPEAGEPPPPPPGSFVIEIGSAADPVTGAGGFRAIPEMEALPLRPGSQGGLHVYVNLRLPEAAVDALSERPLVYREARRISDGTLVSRLEHRTTLVASSTVAAYDTERSLTLFLCPTPVDVDVADEPLELTVELSPDYGEAPLAHGTLRFVPYCADDEEEEFCRRLCLW